MSVESKVGEYILALKSSPRMGHQVVCHRVLPEAAALSSEPNKPWPEPIKNVLRHTGIHRLYAHQAEAVNYLRDGKHVIVATPTASGKTLIYNLFMFEKILQTKHATALYLFPLKALAQDQLRSFRQQSAWLKTANPTAEIYDGDTSAYRRRKIRKNPPNVILSNPEMLHLSLLPHHRKWVTFLSRLKMVVVDEVHTYRGVLGSHLAQIFRRFRRICDHYGASPVYLFSSATVGNPGLLAEQLSGLPVHSVTCSGAPKGRRHVLLMVADETPARSAILLLKAAISRNLRTIVYTQSRKLTELIAIWAGTKSGAYANRISAYRAGLLPEERRDIESRLASGDLLAVVSTSALELGIDIGDLDLCILVGYPGTIVSMLQRGGRVGRSGQESGLILIAGEDALDQYFIRNPQQLFDREPEVAVVNPQNPLIMERHLVCAAAELPLKTDESLARELPVQKAIARLETKGQILRSADGKILYSKKKAPHRKIDLRGSGDRFVIVHGASQEIKGEIDEHRVFRETHPGAIYLHNGEPHLVEHLDIDARTVYVSRAHVDYYTRVRGEKDTDVLEIYERKSAHSCSVFFGRLKVTDRVTGYEKWAIQGKKRLALVPLSLPADIFETEGLWFEIPFHVQREVEVNFFDFLGGLHALEHAAIGIFPLLVMADRNDLGGLATAYHPQLKGAAIFIYDGISGGAGLTRQAYRRADRLLEYTLEVVLKCPCKDGCPSCVHSPKCGSGNRPLDKKGSIFLLKRLLRPAVGEVVRVSRVKEAEKIISPPATHPVEGCKVAVFDLETQRSAQEVGGWHRADQMRMSCAVVYDMVEDRFLEYLEDQVSLLLEHLKRCDLVVGFNIKCFDYHVLRGYSDFDFGSIQTLDILEEIRKRLGFRVSLNHLARATLGVRKTVNGLQALKWWKQGRIEDIVEYCKTDVRITRDLYLFGKEKGYLLFYDKAGTAVRVPVNW
ncbi:MAG: DEAD/DEAH box helicase [Deltaproteobacteria bacterium]|nr:DEAD/DEAH box helicase [Deltaproteobacteria bacterium]